MRRFLAAVGLLIAASIVFPPAASAPKLVVVIVVDQMRADYIERFHDNWSSGLRRLVDNGAWFSHAAYPYLSTLTCAGHATIATGAYPHVHGVIGNTWFDRQGGSVTPCTDDPNVRAIAY